MGQSHSRVRGRGPNQGEKVLRCWRYVRDLTSSFLPFFMLLLCFFKASSMFFLIVTFFFLGDIWDLFSIIFCSIFQNLHLIYLWCRIIILCELCLPTVSSSTTVLFPITLFLFYFIVCKFTSFCSIILLTKLLFLHIL